MKGSKLLKLLILAFQVVWLNAILPGHQRGIVAVPGAQAQACCGSHAAADKEHPGKCPKGDPAKICAICLFSALLSTPPAIEQAPIEFRLLECLPVSQPAHCCSINTFLPYDGRAPPAVGSPSV